MKPANIGAAFLVRRLLTNSDQEAYVFRYLLKSLVMAAWLLAMSFPANATVWDLAADWGDTTNPFGPWSLTDSSGNPLGQVTNFHDLAQPAWGFFGWAKMSVPSTRLDRRTQIGDVTLHSQNDGTSINAVWTAPVTSIIDITGSRLHSFDDSEHSVRANDWQILLNSTVLASGGTDFFTVLTDLSTIAALSGVSVSTGDEITLSISKRAGQTFGTFTDVALNIATQESGGSEVPEPGTLALLGLGLAGLGFIRRRTRRRMAHVICTVLVLALVMAPGAQVEAAPFFIGLGDLSGGTFFSNPQALSADGTTAVGTSSSVSGEEAMRWTSAGGMAGLGDLSGGSFLSAAQGVSGDGPVVVGNSSSTSGTQAFKWTSGGGMVGVGDLSGGIFSSDAHAVSADGTTIVGAGVSAAGVEAFKSVGGVMSGLGDLTGGGFVSRAFGVSADGSVVVGAGDGASGKEAFRWEGGVMSGLGDLAGGTDSSQALSVSADGSVVVGIGTSTSGSEAFCWEGGVMTGLGDLAGGGFSSRASSVSGNGQVIVGFGETASSVEAFVWDSFNGMRHLQTVLETDFGLDLTGWTLVNATGVSDNGLIIAGNGTNPDGKTEGWIVSLETDAVPEPGTLALFAVGLAGLGLVRRRSGATAG